ncbi:MAG TPA: N-6 DNA methylase [Aggregatilinea sp.]|uniref:class I SAM-dependent DNA methyltransferase n=1 Tax=Aggregatilinea sp. TaxID=2806333 RepID=UPI002C14010F|nr:DNA methyltransferase [Aggregatilinea sp.]HML24423.1 N-6 DNA methylase [Aggregatilinea sp.]
MNSLTPQRFIDKWSRTELKERASAQEHFSDVCHLVGHATPAEMDPRGEFFTYEYGMKTSEGRQGYADVWYKDHFAIEYKGKNKYDTLDGALQQLQRYRENLHNPPLLVVCDIEHWEVHTNWTNTEKQVYRFTNADILTPRVQRILRALFFDPAYLHPDRTAAEVTADAADVFRDIAQNMRQWEAAPERIAHFLTKLVFCLFAEDVGLLPAGVSGKRIFTEIIEATREKPKDFVYYTQQLFQAMAEGGKVMLRDIPYFDGRLFEDVAVEEISYEALAALEKACHLDWSAVEPAIFGTLFERSLDPGKRAQLGAHYTSRDDILLIVEPVLMQPLRREWEAIQQEAAPVRERYDAALASGPRAKVTAAANELIALRERILARLRSITVLDPACGSGNFLYVSLQLLKDMEKEVILHPLFAGLQTPFPAVHPRQLFGIEINEIAHDLASIVVWIGYIQWQQNNGYLSFKEPILEPLDNIRQMDAILAFDADGAPVEPEWPSADVIVSNPPFLGSFKRREQLGDSYVDALAQLYDNRMSGFTDLVTYWFERAKTQLQQGKVKRVGLLATNSIRGGTNREVLNRIKEVGDIFMAWSDREWILEGAAVRVSMVGFDDGSEFEKELDGQSVAFINSDLTKSVDVTGAQRLKENIGISSIGPQKDGPLDIPQDLAETMLAATNISKLDNSNVVKPYMNGNDIVKRSRQYWVIDFASLSEEEAAQYEIPFKYLEQILKPIRSTNRDRQRRENWWRMGRSGSDYRASVAGLTRQIFTPRVAKHRVFVWVDVRVFPDSAVVAIARSDDYFFGVLHSKLHEVWSLRMGTWLGKGNDPRYTPTTTFETFPFPWPPGQEPTDHPTYRAINAAAQQLHTEREAWLNPPGVPESRLKKRTLTNLYNALQVFRGEASGRVETAAGDFAPRLDVLHRTLDEAVCDAYSWPHAILADEEEMLRRLLALNLERAGDA